MARYALLPLAGAAALLAAAPATAGAARTERFVAFFKLDQRTTWSDPSHDGPIQGSCDSSYFERHGSETATLKTEPARVRVTRLPGGGMAIAYGNPRKPKPALFARGKVDRTYVHKSYVTDGPCRPTAGRVTGREDDVDTTCDGPFGSRVILTSIMGRLKPTISHYDRLALLTIDECQMTFPEGANALGTGIVGRLPAGRVFGDEELVIVRARDTMTETVEGRKATTHVRWTLRMRRAT